mgnify:CR=1 FL=1
MRIICVPENTTPRLPSPASVRRVAAAIADVPADWIRPGVTAAEIAAEMLEDTGVQPTRMSKDDFDCAFADAAAATLNAADDIRDAR